MQPGGSVQVMGGVSTDCVSVECRGGSSQFIGQTEVFNLYLCSFIIYLAVVLSSMFP